MRESRILLGKRRGSHGAGTWSPPGGHLELGESVFDCASRETREETGFDLAGMHAGPWTNDIFEQEGKHYVTLWVLAVAPPGEPELREPDKCDEWSWFAWHDLPEPLFLPLANLRSKGFHP